MTANSISFERLFSGHEHWDVNVAIGEIEVYCDLLEHLQDKRDSLVLQPRFRWTEEKEKKPGVEMA